MINRKIAVAAVGFFVLLNLMAGDRNPLPEVKYERYRLANGLDVILVEDHSVPIVGVNINYKVGSKNERPGKTGFAHLFEHMMFQGSKHFDDDYFKPLEEVGAYVNGGTNTDRTRYLEIMPSAYLERALYMESDRMGFLLDAMTQERLSNQISVVQNERRQRYDNAPYGTVREKMLAVLYPPDHPYHWTTIGSMADLQAATLDDVKEFFRTYYTPNNANLCIAGDFDPKIAKDLVEKYFGAIPPGPPVARLDRWVPTLPGEVVLAIEDRVQLPRTYIAWHAPAWYAADDAALDVFGQVLGGGKTSRLYRRLVYDLQIAQEATAYDDASQLAGLFWMVLTPRPGHTLEEVEKEASAVLAEALDKGITKQELDRVVTQVTAEKVRAMERVGGFGGLSDRMNSYVHYLGSPDRFRWDLQRYLDLTPEAVNAAARRTLGPNRVVARVTPSAKMAPSTSDLAKNVDRTVMPGPGPAGAFRLPTSQRFTLSNGLAVMLVEQHEVPVVEARLVLPGGSGADPAERPGLADLTAAMLTEGAAGRTSQQIAEAAEGLGAELSAEADYDAVTASLSALRDRIEPSLALLADVVVRPDFPAAELERLKKARLVQFQQNQDRVTYLGQVATARVLYGDGPYGHLPSGTAEGISAASLEDLKTWWGRYGVPAGATLVVAGDLTKAEALPLLEKAFSGWKGGPRPELPVPAAPEAPGRTLYLVDKPGAAQSMIFCGHPGLARTSPDYVLARLANEALGGGGAGRLFQNLREDKGYTYGAYSTFQFRRGAGPFMAYASVATAVTAPAVSEFLKEIGGVTGDRPVTEREFEFCKSSLVNGYAQGFETPSQVADKLSGAVLYGLSEDALESFPADVAAQNLEGVRGAAKRTIHADRLAVVVVGDRSKVQADLEKLGLGPAVLLDQEGHRIPPSA